MWYIFTGKRYVTNAALEIQVRGWFLICKLVHAVTKQRSFTCHIGCTFSSCHGKGKTMGKKTTAGLY